MTKEEIIRRITDIGCSYSDEWGTYCFYCESETWGVIRPEIKHSSTCLFVDLKKELEDAAQNTEESGGEV